MVIVAVVEGRATSKTTGKIIRPGAKVFQTKEEFQKFRKDTIGVISQTITSKTPQKFIKKLAEEQRRAGAKARVQAFKEREAKVQEQLKAKASLTPQALAERRLQKLGVTPKELEAKASFAREPIRTLEERIPLKAAPEDFKPTDDFPRVTGKPTGVPTTDIIETEGLTPRERARIAREVAKRKALAAEAERKRLRDITRREIKRRVISKKALKELKETEGFFPKAELLVESQFEKLGKQVDITARRLGVPEELPQPSGQKPVFEDIKFSIGDITQLSTFAIPPIGIIRGGLFTGSFLERGFREVKRTTDVEGIGAAPSAVVSFAREDPLATGLVLLGGGFLTKSLVSRTGRRITRRRIQEAIPTDLLGFRQELAKGVSFDIFVGKKTTPKATGLVKGESILLQTEGGQLATAGLVETQVTFKTPFLGRQKTVSVIQEVKGKGRIKELSEARRIREKTITDIEGGLSEARLKTQAQITDISLVTPTKTGVKKTPIQRGEQKITEEIFGAGSKAVTFDKSEFIFSLAGKQPKTIRFFEEFPTGTVRKPVATRIPVESRILLERIPLKQRIEFDPFPSGLPTTVPRVKTAPVTPTIISPQELSSIIVPKAKPTKKIRAKRPSESLVDLPTDTKPVSGLFTQPTTGDFLITTEFETSLVGIGQPRTLGLGRFNLLQTPRTGIRQDILLDPLSKLKDVTKQQVRTKLKPTSIFQERQIFRQRVKQRQKVKTKQKVRQRQRQRQRLAFAPLTPAVTFAPPPTTFFILPPIPERRVKKPKKPKKPKRKRKLGVTPTARAAFFELKGKTPQIAVLSGITERPLQVRKRRKR